MSETDDSEELTAEQRERLAVIRSAESLADLQELTGAASEHDAYLQAKAEWEFLRGRELGDPPESEGLPGDRVDIDGQAFHVHGITHADTEAERAFLRRHVRRILDDGGDVYCEQGIRPMYFQDIAAVCEIDDYRWAMHHCRERNIDSHIEGEIERAFEENDAPNLESVTDRLREVTFSLLDSGSDVYGDRFASALGDVASDFLTSHEEVATGESFASFQKSRAAAEDPAQMGRLQHHYKRAFLPQPLEREWLRRHDRELELFTHARNERIAAYALAHASEGAPLHIVTGAAHQPGIVYYLRAYRDGEWDYRPFETVP